MKKESYSLLKSKRDLAIESFISYLDFAMNKQKDWEIDSKMILKYGLIAELMFNYFRNKDVQSRYANILVEQITSVSSMMEMQNPEKYKDEYKNCVIGCNVAVIVVNKILNRVPVRKDEVMSAFISITSNEILKDYMADKFKGIDVLNLLEIVYNKFPEKIANEKVR